jgi:hypothetical protein
LIPRDSIVNKQVVSLLKTIIGDPNIKVINTDYAVRQPFDYKRIEFKFFNMFNTGNNTVRYDKDIEDTLRVTSYSEYKGDLLLRFVGSPFEVSEQVNKVTTLLPLFEFVDTIAPNIVFRPGTIRTKVYETEDNGVLFNLYELKVSCSIELSGSYDLEYFTDIEEGVDFIKVETILE